MSTNSIVDKLDIVDLAYAYADALDRRDWSALDAVFTPDMTADYAGEYELTGREQVVGMIRTFLDPCGPTQHLLSNPRVRVDGDTAELSIKLRVHHLGAGEHSALTYEIFGWYHALVTRTPCGWRIHHWRQEVTAELGTRDLFTA
ncbi:nuclear transport factor 2 family protein [Nocardia asteroides]|uniref:nuclear transport factor 2 family protein n=1 Tax=Nocardia asteroides TaxID=1824 RepID=UPI001E32ADB4|nr:nuclear transport factor 2 family protein [Nocardia asteroides]UGT53430.1 nuclear transport factor 2 family protein [Nocardia asteroides]